MNSLQRLNIFDNMMKDIVNKEFKDWLIGMGFFEAPASAGHHGNHEGGLFEHSLAVTEELVQMTDKLNLEWGRKESPWIVGMFHDLCKIDLYKKVVDVEGKTMFGSDEVTGEQAHFEYNSESLFTGHGEKSIMLLSQFMTLTCEEIACIRYHMGAYEKDRWDEYGKAVSIYPNVLFTHTADMIASKVRNI